MTNLGSLGAIRPQAAADEFEWFGATIRTRAGITDLVLADFMEIAGHLDIESVAQAAEVLGVLKGFLRDLIDEADFDQFWLLGKRNGQGLTDLLTVGKAIIEQVTSRPTLLPADSTDGQPRTPENSVSALESIAEQAFPGRPDLQVMLLRAAEQQTS